MNKERNTKEKRRIIKETKEKMLSICSEFEYAKLYANFEVFFLV